MNDSHDHECRFNSPGATTFQTTLYERTFTQFESDDTEAAEHYVALLNEIKASGLPLAANEYADEDVDDDVKIDLTYKSPVGKAALRRLRRGYTPTPWCGELRIEGSESNEKIEIHWRVYFSDLRIQDFPLEEIDDVLLCSTHKKEVRKGLIGKISQKIRDNQDRAIDKALASGLRWCRADGTRTLRALGYPVERVAAR